MYVMKPNIQH